MVNLPVNLPAHTVDLLAHTADPLAHTVDRRVGIWNPCLLWTNLGEHRAWTGVQVWILRPLRIPCPPRRLLHGVLIRRLHTILETPNGIAQPRPRIPCPLRRLLHGVLIRRLLTALEALTGAARTRATITVSLVSVGPF